MRINLPEDNSNLELQLKKEINPQINKIEITLGFLGIYDDMNGSHSSFTLIMFYRAT